MSQTTRAVLDTSVVIATDVEPLEGELAISAATPSELHFGILVATDPAVRAERLRRLSVLQRRFHALPVDEAVAASRALGPRTCSSPRPRTPTEPGCTPATPQTCAGWAT